VFARRRAWHEPEPRGWHRALRGLLTAAIGIGVPVVVFVWIWSAVAPRPAEQPPPPSIAHATVPEPDRGPEGVGVVDGDASWVGYRIEELVPRLGEHFEVVGRTTTVSGRLTLDGSTVVDALVQANVRDLESDNDRRDRALQRRFLESLEYPDARFAIVEPIPLLGIPEAGEPTTVAVTGELTVRETTRVVRPLLRVRWDGDRIRTVGTVPIELADYGVRNPVLPGFRIVEESGVIELDLTFVRES
jgi:polyisoprenoid-binding protein YceI